MTLNGILAAATTEGDAISFPGPDAWKQGRTLFGGLTAALCLHSARQRTGESRQLRSAMISFVGPSTGAVKARATLLRSGRTAATVRASLTSDDAPATEALLTFSDLRGSALSHSPPASPITTPPDAAKAIDFASAGGPAFARNFEVIMVAGSLPMSGSKTPHILWWARHRDPAAHGTEAGLMCLGDILPPAALAMATGPTPISSMTWMLDMVGDDITTDDGWYLLEARADAVGGGFSTQDMSIWNTAGALIAKGRQMVAMFA